MPGRRALVLALPLLAAACAGSPPRSFPPLRYDYLTPLQLGVAEIEYGPLPAPGPLDALSPAPAGPALRQLVQDRLSAAGSSGRAIVTIGEARITRTGNGLDGAMAVRVDIVGPDGGKGAFAEAHVTRNLSGLGDDLRGTLYDFTRQMLDDMNVELEFQLRRSLRDVLQATGAAPTPAAVEKQDLAAPRPAR